MKKKPANINGNYKTIAVRLTNEEVEKLMKVKTWYRAASKGHAIRNLIEDAFKGISNGVRPEEEFAKL